MVSSRLASLVILPGLLLAAPAAAQEREFATRHSIPFATINDVLDNDKGRRVALSLTFFATDLF